MTSDKKSFSFYVVIKTIPSCSANQHHISPPISVHIIASNLQRIINLLKCHKFQTNLLARATHLHQLFNVVPALLILQQKKLKPTCVDLYDVVLLQKIVFHFNFLLDVLVFVCDCCRKFLLPFSAVQVNLCT